MRQFIFWFLFLIFFINSVNAQLTSIDSSKLNRLFNESMELNQEGDAELIFSKLDSMIILAKELNASSYVLSGLAFKGYFAELNDLLTIYYSTIQEIEFLLKNKKVELGDNGESYRLINQNNLGLYFLRRGSYNRAEVIFTDLLDKYRRKEEVKITSLANTLWNLTSVHKNKGNYKLALSIANEWKSIVEEHKTNFSVDYQAMVHKFIAEIYEGLGNKEDALNNFLKASTLIENIVVDNRNVRNRVLSVYNTYALYLKKIGDPKKALPLLKKSLSYQTGNDPLIEETYRAYGESYATLGDTINAILNFKKSLENNQFDLKNFHTSRTYFAFGNMYAQEKLFKVALNYYQKSLWNLEDNFDSTDICVNPENLETVFAKKELLKVLHQKAIALLAISKENPDYLACSWQTIQLAIKLMDDIKVDNSGEYDKQFLVEERYPIFEDAIKISLAQPNQQGTAYALEVSEKSKATLLLAAVRNTQVSNFLVPDSLMDMEQQYKFELQSLEEDRYEANRQNKEVEEYDKKIGHFQQKLAALNAHLQKNYPKYYSFRYDNRTSNITQIKQRLSNESVFIEYFVGQNQLYVFLVQKEKEPRVFEIPIASDSLKVVIQDFLQAIYIPYIDSKDKEILALKNLYSKEYADSIYAEKGFQLYQLLLAPILTACEHRPVSLEIIPDGILNYLPFDALLERAVNPDFLGYYENSSDYQYLARKYQINYCYSATLMELMQAKNKNDSPEKKLLVFHNEEFESQTSGIKAAFAPYEIFSSFVDILGARANKTTFQEESSAYKYLHFSVHGNINNVRPHQSQLQLRPNTTNGDSLLFLRDIYNTSLPAEMVFTSACNAGVGTLTKGEGLLSLARGFAYAGAKSLITTLWEIKGGPSNQMIKTFYEELSNGRTKDTALTLAKRNQMKDPTYAHPYYWAGFIPIGNMEAIALPMSIQQLIIGGIISVLLLGLLFSRFRKYA